GVRATAGKGREKPKAEGSYNGLPDHVTDFLACVASRRPPRAHVASVYQTTTVCHLANVAHLAGRSVRWDKAKDDLAGDAGRDTLAYRREYRKPWKLPYA